MKFRITSYETWKRVSILEAETEAEALASFNADEHQEASDIDLITIGKQTCEVVEADERKGK